MFGDNLRKYLDTLPLYSSEAGFMDIPASPNSLDPRLNQAINRYFMNNRRQPGKVLTPEREMFYEDSSSEFVPFTRDLHTIPGRKRGFKLFDA